MCVSVFVCAGKYAGYIASSMFFGRLFGRWVWGYSYIARLYAFIMDSIAHFVKRIGSCKIECVFSTITYVVLNHRCHEV